MYFFPLPHGQGSLRPLFGVSPSGITDSREVQPFIGVMPCRGAFGTKDFIGSVIVDELAFGLVLIRPESQERRTENKNLTFRDGSIRRVVDGA